MKIGILTFHSAYNYGAFLQTYAMQEYLQSLGHDVCIINYAPIYFEQGYSVFPLWDFKKLNIQKKLFRLVGNIILFLPRLRRKNVFKEAINKQLKISGRKLKNTSDIENVISNYDALIFGSDQIWNPKITRGFDDVFWGNFDFDGKKIAYAASVGDDFLPLENQEIQHLLDSFLAISVRERELSNFLDTRFNIKTDMVVDPTLLLSKNDWTSHLSKKIKTRFVFLYIVIPSENALRVAKRIADELKIKLITVYAGISHKPITWKNASCSPLDLVNYINSCAFFVTTSFHGTAFAINLQKQFYVVKTTHENKRVNNLLEITNLTNRLIIDESSIDLKNNIDWNVVAFNEEIIKSKSFIQGALLG